MTYIPNSLADKLAEHLGLLTALTESFDRGNDIVALSIATAIRVLLHDTQRSTSLLTHLGKKERVGFLSSYSPDSGGPVDLGLVRRINVGVHDGTGGEAKYWALCDERYFPTPTNRFRVLPFDDWWGERVFSTSVTWLTRKDLVLAVANKDGGSHFDTQVEERYDVFRKSWSGGSTIVGRASGRARGYDNIPTHPAIRQIAHEIMKSLT
jgi:hypothetical protein